MASYRVKVSAGGKVALPAAVRRKHDFLPGRTLIIEDNENGIAIHSLDAAVARVQAFVRTLVPPERILSDELIADRRVEADRE
jgi:bifunctional DNA-binding transcriptional regulator/antitoxin component of YhaV-PrlF toxin-antitoxin module